MKLVATIGILSDTHNKHLAIEARFGIPQCDIIIHAGDFSMLGEEKECMDFFNWFAALPIQHKIVIGGNHDIWLDKGCPKYNTLLNFGGIIHSDFRDVLPEGILYLENEAAEIMGIKFYGTPVQPSFNNWAFNYERDSVRQAAFDMIPDDTQFLITHCPPKGVLDTRLDGTSLGDRELALKIVTLPNIRVNVFGHIHESRGIDISGQITYINATNVNGSYHPIHKPIVLQYFDDGSFKEKKEWQKLSSL